MNNTSTQHLGVLVFGGTLGFVLARLGFADYAEVQRLFSFADLRLLLCFGTAVALGFVGFAVLRRLRAGPGQRPIHRGTVPGAVLFGAGWALTGACPSVVLVQLGLGYVPALYTAGGILVGVWLYRQINRGYLRWDSGSCDS